MEISKLYEIFKEYPVVTTDTRNSPKNSIFFALKGANFNGNLYAQKAIENGCSYAVVDEEQYATLPNIIFVEDSLKTLQQLANYHRRVLKIPIIAITGTNGKTTTKELISAVLSKEYNIISTEGNFNNHIGVPLTLLSMKPEHEIAVVEMGANHVGEIKILSEIVEPNYGLITNLGRAHIEGFGSFENVVKTKCELYDYIKLIDEGKVFVDYDDKLLRDLSKDMTAIYYGQEDDLFVSGRVLSVNPFLEFEWRFASLTSIIKTHLIGNYNLSNLLAAITIGKYMGIKTEYIKEAIEEYVPVNLRSQLKETPSNILIIDAYNANPSSMKAALENFNEMNVPRKVLILGDMKELGHDSNVEHQNILDYIQQHQFNQVYLVGDNFSRLSQEGYMTFPNSDLLHKYLLEHPVRDSYVLLKASRGIELEKCVDAL